MNSYTLGDGAVKILIVHGWLHTGEWYRKLASNLKNVSVTVITLPGFGGVSVAYQNDNRRIDSYVYELECMVVNNKYDLIIGHSLGGLLLIKLLERNVIDNNCKIILMNPIYDGLRNLYPLRYTKYLNKWLLSKINQLETRKLNKYKKLLFYMSMQDPTNLSKDLLKSIQFADSDNACILLNEMILDRGVVDISKYGKQVKILYSEKDRIVQKSSIQKLNKNLGFVSCISLGDTGHTCILESYSAVEYQVELSIQEILQSRGGECCIMLKSRGFCELVVERNDTNNNIYIY